MRIIPAIDIIDGKCVRLSKGDYDSKIIYSESPLEVAKSFEANGITHLHLVDLDGAKSKQIVNYKILEKIASSTKLTIDFGGGIKRDEDLKIAFNSGAQQITAGSIAAKDRALFLSWIKKYGAEKIILGADCKHRKIATDGWLEASEVNVIDFIKGYESEGIASTICTDISKDGMLKGPSISLYKEILASSKVELIASGGVSCIEDLHELKAIGCAGTIVGKAIYENRITLAQIAELC